MTWIKSFIIILMISNIKFQYFLSIHLLITIDKTRLQVLIFSGFTDALTYELTRLVGYDLRHKV